MMQPRFDKRVGTSPFSLVDQPRFRAGFDFLRLRAQVGEVEEELSHWWETFSTASDAMREDMVDAQRRDNLAKPGAGKARRVKRTDADHPASEPAADPRFRATDEEGDEEGSPEDAAEGVPPDGSAPAKKRRRRRRKPSGAGRADGGAGEPGPTD
jgi:poly(A) polymerase